MFRLDPPMDRGMDRPAIDPAAGDASGTVASEPARSGHLAELTRLLWAQRELISELEFRLEVQQLIMTNGRHDRLHLAVADVESVLDRIRTLEDQRLGVVAECAIELGLPVGASLQQLIDAAP